MDGNDAAAKRMEKGGCRRVVSLPSSGAEAVFFFFHLCVLLCSYHHHVLASTGYSVVLDFAFVRFIYTDEQTNIGRANCAPTLTTVIVHHQHREQPWPRYNFNTAQQPLGTPTTKSMETTSQPETTTTPTPDADDVTILFDNSRGKKNCWGPLLRCAVAFGIRQVVVVGPTNRCNEKGSHGASKHVQIKAFPTVESAVEFLSGYRLIGLLPYCPSRNSKEISNNPKPIINEEKSLPVEFDGIENVCCLQHQDQQLGRHPSRTTNTESIDNSRNERFRSLSFPACSRPFGTKNTRNGNDTRNERPGNVGTCFVVDRSTTGLPLKFAHHCDGFIHIPHLGVDDQDQDNDRDESDKKEEEIENDCHEKTATNCSLRTKDKLRYGETDSGNVAEKNKSVQNSRERADASRPSSLLVLEACLSIVLYEYKCWWVQQQPLSQQFPSSTSTFAQNGKANARSSDDELDHSNVRTYVGQKYEVDQKMLRGFISVEERREIQEERRRKKKQRVEEDSDDSRIVNN